ncbi:hypothetical protein [Capybara microvirus Cap3_SP_297]|nr:hypothetical protein [Capybara microvirus Cap3_SP_297]
MTRYFLYLEFPREMYLDSPSKMRKLFLDFVDYVRLFFINRNFYSFTIDYVRELILVDVNSSRYDEVDSLLGELEDSISTTKFDSYYSVF